MKQTTQVEETLLSSVHAQLHKQISMKQIGLSSCIALAGIVAIVLMSVMDDTTDSTLNMVLLTIGIILLLYSLYRFLTRSQELIYKPTGSEVRSGSLYMDSTELQHLQQMVKKNDFASSSRLVFKEGGNGRIDYLASKDNRFVGIQLFQFVPYTYESVSDKLYYTDDDAAAVARCMNI